MRKAQKPFRRGYSFKLFRGDTSAGCLTKSAADRLYVPLSQGPGEAATPIVTAGEAVESGQLIATADGFVGSPVHAPVASTVESIEKTRIVLQPVGGDEKTIKRIDGANSEWKKLDAAAIRKLLYASGVAAIDPDGIPTESQSAVIGPEEVERVVVKLIPDDILNPLPTAVLDGERFNDFIAGLAILAAAFPGIPVTVAVSDRLGELGSSIEGAVETGIDVVSVSHRYPQSSDPVLIQALTGQAYPYGFSPIHLGIVSIDYQTALHAHMAVTEGLPVLIRRIAVAGEAITETTHLDVHIGTPVAALLEGRIAGDPVRTIMDSVMAGTTAGEDEVVTRSTRGVYCIPEADSIETFAFASPGFSKDSITNTFLARFLPIRKETNTNLHGEQRACLNCSFCADVCPVGIMPNVLHPYVERELVSETLPRLGIMRCIDCNLCTYVCPSKIPLADLMRKGKKQLIDEGYVTEEYLGRTFTLKGLSS